MALPGPTEKYRYLQRLIQNEGGWCFGMTICLQHHLIDKGVTTAANAFTEITDELGRVPPPTVWGEMNVQANQGYRAPIVTFPVELGQPVRVTTLVHGVNWSSKYGLSTMISWGIGQANHACLLFPAQDGIMFFEPNWGVAYWQGLMLPSTENAVITLINEIIEYGYRDIAEQSRTASVIALYKHWPSSYQKALHQIIQNRA